MASIVEFDEVVAEGLRAAAGQGAVVLSGLDTLRSELDEGRITDVVVLGPSIDQDAALSVAATYRVTHPLVGFVLVRQRVDNAILADALRAGIREVVSDRDLAEVSAAIRRSVDITTKMMSVSSDGDVRRPRGKVVTVFSAKGGCGKTTLSTNMAAHLARSGGASVVLVDLDLAFGDVAIVLQLDAKHSMMDVFGLGDRWDGQAVRSLLTRHDSGALVLAAPDDPSMAEKIDEGTIRELIGLLAEEFDYVIIDTPPALDPPVLAAFDESDVVALLTTLDIPSLKNLKITLRTLDLLAFPRDKARVVLNRSDSKVGLEPKDVDKALGMPVSAHIPSSREVPTLANRGLPIATENSSHSVSKAIARFADQLFTHDSATAAGATVQQLPKRNGFMRRKKAS
jgi:pilus assembly protein CpaE